MEPLITYAHKGRTFEVEQIIDEYEIIDGFRIIDQRGYHHYDVIRDDEIKALTLYNVTNPHGDTIGYLENRHGDFAAWDRTSKKVTDCDSLIEAAAYLIINQ